ncbi:MAG: hypothetical protein ACKO6L_10370 [Flavobacteriales bacterium]
MMRTLAFILVFLMACSKQEIPSAWYVSGVINPAETQHQFFIWNGQNATEPWTDIEASAVLEGGNQSYALAKTDSGYALPWDAQLLFGTTYTLTCTLDKQSVRTRFRIPAAVIPADTSSIVIGAQDEPVWVQWSMGDSVDYAFLYELHPMAQNGEPSPLVGSRFDERFLGPQRSSALDIRPEDFTYTGLHELVVYAIPVELENIYFNSFSDLRGLIQRGPDEVEGGKGFVAGISEARWKINFTP